MRIFYIRYKEILLDDEDYDRVAERKWNAMPDGHFNTIFQGKGHTMVTETLQRFILGYGGPLEVAHKDGNPRNNQKENLVPITHRENMQSCCNNTSGHAGVYQQKKQSKSWCANIWLNGKNQHIGSFYTKEEAVLARVDYVNKLRLEGVI